MNSYVRLVLIELTILTFFFLNSVGGCLSYVIREQNSLLGNNVEWKYPKPQRLSPIHFGSKCPHLDTSPVVRSQPTLYGFTPGSPAEIIRVKGPGGSGRRVENREDRLHFFSSVCGGLTKLQ
ncbi:hypothetical protein CDAR_207161 [Caerostris darwini]|uniref:Secreted protein n=1 Tax=Caerostris darwini TaxID=1538125 RepID=A0AAV4SQM8_9ARAC|nr:hypothetical protein CDAR_207161 [Caerostris darwini]